MDRTQRQRKAEMIKSEVFETNKEEKPGCLLVIPLRDPSIAAKSVPSPNVSHKVARKRWKGASGSCGEERKLQMLK